MTTFRRTFTMMSIALLATVLLAACGGVQGTNTGGTTGNTTGANVGTTMTATTATPTAKGSMNNYPTPSATATVSGNATNDGGDQHAFIHTAIVTINGNKVHVLTTNKGFLLYYYMKDTMLTSNCTGGCAQAWPPLVAPAGMMTINSSVSLPKKLSVHKTANGNQVFYDGHALYTYVSDTQPGQFTGRGSGNAWYLVGITL